MGQFKALANKNWILYKRSIIGSILQILLPVIFIAFFILVRNLARVTITQPQSFVDNPTYDYSLSPQILSPAYSDLFDDCEGEVIALAPSGNAHITSLSSFLTSLGLNVTTYQSDEAMEAFARDANYGTTSPTFCFGVSFVQNAPNYKYKLRFNITARRSTAQGPYSQLDLTTERAFDSLTYFNTYQSRMALATHAMNSIIAASQTGQSMATFDGTIVPIYQQYHVNDSIFNYLEGNVQFLVLFPLLILYLRQISQMISEKQKKIRESMLIMGMKLSLYYLTWFIRYFVVYVVTHGLGCVLILLALKNIPYYVPFIVFIMFDIVLIFQAFFIQIFFTKAKIGMVFALIFFILQYIVNYLASNSEHVTAELFQRVSISPHAAFIQAFRFMLHAESQQAQFSFSTQLNNYSIATALISFAGNIVFWGLLFVYLDQVVPNEWGARKHCFFCCVNNNKPSEQNDGTAARIHPEPSVNSDIESVDGKFKEMEENSEAIRLRRLKKEFEETKAVKDLNLTMYKDQIFVLLGHNGAGKTTTISMITGMLEPTQGSIEVFGETDVDEIRNNIGICPQHDTLYDDLTVEEHLELFATFRGFQGQQLQEQVSQLIKDVNLQQKRHQYSKNLSGGQKRRVSVALAFAGGSKVIVLDQPTSGMDTSARRYIWQMLKNYKQGRIILLTTHFMDQADYLGDRIGIMAKGELVTCGSNVFLKNKFGVGYNIVFVKTSISVLSQKIVSCVQKHVPTAKILSDVSSQLSMQLPLDKVKSFSGLFTQIDSHKKQLGIETYGISITTLEEVFLKLGEGEEENSNEMEDDGLDKIQLQHKKKSIPLDEEEWQRQDGCCERFFSHLLATILKRLRTIKRDIKSFLFELVLPMAIITLALYLMTISFIRDTPAQELNYKIYYENESSPNPTVVPIGSSDSAYLSSLQTKMQEVYGNNIQVRSQVNSNIIDFDTNFLYPIKQVDQTLKGGIYYSISNGTYVYKALANTRSPTSLLTVQTLAMQTIMNQVSGNNSTITVVNAALPRTYRQIEANNTISGFLGAMIFSVALSFKFSSIISFIVKERVDKSKHQQIVSGMNIGSYWVGNYLFDFFLYALVAGFAIAMCQILKVEILSQGDAYTATIILFLLYGLVNIPVTYILGYFFKDYGNAQAIIYFFNFVAGGIVPIIILVLRWVSNPDDAVPAGDIAKGLTWLLRLVPSFSFGEGMINLGSITLLSGAENKGQQFKIFDVQISLGPIIYLAGELIVYFGILIGVEIIQSDQKLMRCFTSENKITQTQQIEDKDVIDEQVKAIQANPDDYEILTKELRKVYMIDSEKGHKVAVDNLSFGVKRGQVFGLLGVNGAGKTTTFKMLAGEIVSTSGDSYFSGYKISQNLSLIRKNLGYCPQFDALIDNLTVREQLQLFYDLKCLPSRFKEDAIDQKIQQMDLKTYEDKLSGTLSGGNKRKLSVAMAMIGNPKIIFLDQPSTGMDPKARRFMWKVISRISTQRKQSTVILTTHSMEEAEALSTRLGIMVSGNFKCIGSPQYIKSKYGKGFQIEIKLKIIKKDEIQEIRNKFNDLNPMVSLVQLNEVCSTLKMREEIVKQINEEGNGNYLWKDLKEGKKITLSSLIQLNQTEERVREIKEALRGKIGQLQIIEQVQSYVRFKTGENVSISALFEFLEARKQGLYIQQYSIKQVTVEQIFNKFAEEDGMNMD